MDRAAVGMVNELGEAVRWERERERGVGGSGRTGETDDRRLG